MNIVILDLNQRLNARYYCDKHVIKQITEFNQLLSSAYYIIDKCTYDDYPISNLQLQLILYFLQGNNYRKYGVSLFSDNIYAWPYSPVVPEVYDEFCSNGIAPIYNLYDVDIESKIQSIINKQIIHCYKQSIWDMVNKATGAGSPWNQTYEGYKTIIPKSIIQTYFCNKIIKECNT